MPMTDMPQSSCWLDATEQLPAHTPPGSPADNWQPLYQRISQLLIDNRLEPNPTNYALAHRYFTAADAAFNQIVDRAMKGGGLNGATAAALIAQRSVELSAADLQIIVADAQARLAEMVKIVSKSGEETRAYGDALQTNAEQLAEGKSPEEVVDSLVGLTTSMISRTRAVEGQLQTACQEIRELRDSLAEAQDAANRDALTGLPNRRALDTRLAVASDTARRTGQPFSVAICDIDHFKAFNDKFGHQIGDEVIKFVASSLSGKDDSRLFAARYGGEEFVVLFEGQDAKSAGSEIERIRKLIAARELTIAATGQKLGHLTFSAGISSFNAEEGTSAMLKRADVSLYEAKRAGRNRVIIADQ